MIKLMVKTPISLYFLYSICFIFFGFNTLNLSAQTQVLQNPEKNPEIPSSANFLEAFMDSVANINFPDSTAVDSMSRSSINLNGYFSCNDGGYYYIRQIGNRVYWFGEHASGAWANVFIGQLSGSTLSGYYYDVPKGRYQGTGYLRMYVSNRGANIVKTYTNGGFGGSRWVRRNVPRNLPRPRSSSPFSSINNINNLNGVWRANDNGTYYIRQIGNIIVWFGERNFSSGRPAWANVAIGRRYGNRIELTWADVPKGRYWGAGRLTLRVGNRNRIYRTGVTGGFGGSSWSRGAVEEPDYRLASFGYGRMKVNGKPALGNRPLLVIRVGFRNEGMNLNHSHSYYNQLFFGNGTNRNNPSAANYFRENSFNKFSFSKAGVVYVHARNNPNTPRDESDIDCFFRRNVECRNDPNNNEEWPQALPQILNWVEDQSSFRFGNYDANRDGIITADELSIIIVHADRAPADGGAARWVSSNLKNNYRYNSLVAICQESAGFATIVHELSHLLGTLDLYGSRGRNGGMTIMSGTITGNEDDKWSMNMDPYHRMLLGWIKPRIFDMEKMGGTFEVATANRSGYRLYNAKRPAILYSSRVGTHEYFMLEARAHSTSALGFDNVLGGNGVGIWRIRTKSNHWPLDSYVVHTGNDGNLQTARRGDDLIIKDHRGRAIEIHSGGNNRLDSRTHANDFRGHDFHVYVIGPPNLNPPLVGYGRPWRRSDGRITSLYWANGKNSGLEMSIEEYPGHHDYFNVVWNLNLNARSNRLSLDEQDSIAISGYEDTTNVDYSKTICIHPYEQIISPTDSYDNQKQEVPRLGKGENTELLQNFPNPFTHTTTIRYRIPTGANSAKIVFTNTLGQTVKNVQIGTQTSGQITIKSADFKTGSGVYTYSLILDGQIVSSKRMVLY